MNITPIPPPRLGHAANASRHGSLPPALLEATVEGSPPLPPENSDTPPGDTPRPKTGPEQRPSTGVPEKATRILIVEDEAIIALALENTLSRAGYEVTGIADNAEAAVELCQGVTPALVLMDISIRGSADGIETAARILETTDVPIVFLTAYADDATLERAAKVSPHGYIIKPYDERSLLVTARIAIERHRTDERLRVLQHAISAANVGILLVDVVDGGERRISFANESFLSMSGASQEEVLGRRPCFLALDPNEPGALRLGRAISDLHSAHETIAGRTGDGRVFWSSVTATPIAARSGRITHVILFHLDVTREREAERIAAASQRLEVVGRLAAGTAHDFNNILGVIMAFTEAAQSGAQDDGLRGDLKEIATAARRGTELTRKLMGLTRQPDALARQMCDAGRALPNAQRMFERAAGPSVRLRIDIAPQPMAMPTDAGSLEQALLNLVLNARDAMPAGGLIVIRASCPMESSQRFSPGNYVRIEVSDTGVGMTPEVMARIFEPLFTTKAAGTGMGLGLSMCQRIVVNAGGHIGVRSTPGIGTTFVVDLPRLGWVEPDDSDEVEPISDPVRGGVCLLVEDDEQLRRASVRALVQAGFEVHEADTGESACRQLEALGKRLDLLACDMVLPGISGMEVLACARRTAPNASLLVLTGYLDATIASLGQGVEILWKPYAPSTLTRRVASAISHQDRATWAEPARTPIEPVRVSVAAMDDGPISPVLPKILLVDSDPQCVRAVTTILETHRTTAVAALTAREAIASVEAGSFDAALVDVDLTEMPWADLVSRLRSIDPLLPVVVMSNTPSVGTMQQAMQLRATSFLVKPVVDEDLAVTVSQAIQDGQLRRLQQRLLVLKSTTAETFSDLRRTEARFTESLDGLFMVFQPIVRSDGGIFGYEALLRTSGPYRSPLDFLAVAEALGRVEELGRAARRSIAQVLTSRPDRTEPIFVNIHPLEFRSDHLGRDDEPLRPWASRIVLEVTERAQLGSGVEVVDTLRVLRDQGFRFAIDDLGEGYAGLSWLVRLAPDVTKIDMSLIRGIEADPLKRDAVASLVNICRRARAFVVAEGVETAAEARTLRDLGCDLLQGYFFARPGVPFPEVHLGA